MSEPATKPTPGPRLVAWASHWRYALDRPDMERHLMRNFSDKTRHDYIRHVKSFASFLGRSPDSASADDLRRFQLHQRQNGVQPSTMNSAVSALRFFFSVAPSCASRARSR